MENKVYYGEYTLKHWIKLMLSGNIVLPEYQRHFVWRERDVKRLLQSLSDGQFVQPVTIALYDDSSIRQNLILDGQQRLTSLLLAYLGYFPDKKKFELGDSIKVANEDDSAIDDGPSPSEGFLWQYTDLLKYGKDKFEIISNIITSDKYIRITDDLINGLTDDFFEKTYLGFSYVVPETRIATEVQKNFSQLFRSINYFGKKLEPMDSRKSLYYQNQKLTNFFEGKCEDGSDVMGDLRIMEDLQPVKIDFVRYLVILSQYSSSNHDTARDVMMGYSAYSSRESYYADYVSYILGIEQEDRVDKFDRFDFAAAFPDDVWKERFNTLKTTISHMKLRMGLKDNTIFSSWYEADYWLFGLMYYILFEGRQIREQYVVVNDRGRHETLKSEIETAIERMRRNPSFLKNSNRVTFIRNRLVESCNIYSSYVY